jgi:hypothetical protein
MAESAQRTVHGVRDGGRQLGSVCKANLEHV